MNNYRNMMKQGYQEDLQDCVARAAKGQCPPWQQDYCFGEIAQAKGTDAYPEEGDTLLAELRRLVDTVPQCTNREADAAEMAALGGKQLFYLSRGNTLVELVQLPDGSFDGWAYPEAGDALYARTALQAWAQENPRHRPPGRGRAGTAVPVNGIRI